MMKLFPVKCLYEKCRKRFFSQFFSLIQHIYCSIDNTYSSKICIHIKPRTSNLCTVCRKTSATEFLTSQKISYHSKFQSYLWLLIDRPKIPSHWLSGILTYESTQVRSSLLYSAHMRYTHLVFVCTAASYQATPSGHRSLVDN